MIGREQVQHAMTTLEKYKTGKVCLENRIVENERWYKGRHWENIRSEKDLTPTSAWMFNALANKHADAMDNYPAPAVLPREESDMQVAEALSSVLPTLLEYNEFPKTYSDVWWYKLKNGTGVYEVVWDNTLDNGLGNVAIRKADLLNMFWEPGVTDIQKSPHLFHVELRNKKELEEQYPDMDFNAGNNSTITQYRHEETIDISGKVLIVDWYYKKRGKLHFCQFANENILFATENNPEQYPNGFYEHNKYPFVFDVLYPEADGPVGFGIIDLMKDCQTYIDRLDESILQNALVSSRKKIIIRGDGSINEKEMADPYTTIVHSDATLGEGSYREVSFNPLPPIYANILQSKIAELKETSGNRDFSQGAVSGGVTAASSISLLQEAGSKLSRDMINASYRAFAEINYLIIELIRQFYTEERVFRIIGDGGYKFVHFSNRELLPQSQGHDFGLDLGYRLPVFDVSVTAEHESPYRTLSNNELALQFYKLGFFNPAMATQALPTVKMMNFEGRDNVMESISNNFTLSQQVEQLTQQVAQLSAVVDAQNGTTISQDVEVMNSVPKAPMAQGEVKTPAPTQAERASALARGQAAPR